MNSSKRNRRRRTQTLLSKLLCYLNRLGVNLYRVFHAARVAACIAAGPSKVDKFDLSEGARHNLYPVLTAPTETAFSERVELVKRADRAARDKVRSIKRDISEGSEEWDILQKRYYADELKKFGIDPSK